MLKVNDFFRHYKGGLYVTTGFGISADESTRGKRVVLYRDIFNTEETFSRTEEEFTSILPDGITPRFKFLPSSSELAKITPGFISVVDPLFPIFGIRDAELYFSSIQELTGRKNTVPEEVWINLRERNKINFARKDMSLTAPQWPALIQMVSDSFKIHQPQTLQQAVVYALTNAARGLSDVVLLNTGR